MCKLRLLFDNFEEGYNGEMVETTCQSIHGNMEIWTI